MDLKHLTLVWDQSHGNKVNNVYYYVVIIATKYAHQQTPDQKL